MWRIFNQLSEKLCPTIYVSSAANADKFEEIPVKKRVYRIGADACDLVLKDKTVEPLHGILRVMKYGESIGYRLENRGVINPIKVYCPEEQAYRNLKKGQHHYLSKGQNFFLFGETEVIIEVPEVSPLILVKLNVPFYLTMAWTAPGWKGKAAVLTALAMVLLSVGSVTASAINQGKRKELALANAVEYGKIYDYDAAIACLNQLDSSAKEITAAIKVYEEQKAACQVWKPEEVTHIFFHTLIVDPYLAFDGDEDEAGYNQHMVTLDEFAEIMTAMYEDGWVMVGLTDLCTVHEDGTVEPKDILLPEGKQPFVLSQDDVSYYHYMAGDGFADKLVLDEQGRVKNQYIEADGTIKIGDYDMVPWIDTFVEEHPDFSYRGAKGVIALTGYEGVLGYRTDEVYRTREEARLTKSQRKFFEEHPEFDEAAWQNEVEEATKVAEQMKADGWTFASHTWGHMDPKKGMKSTQRDTTRWLENVAPIVGETNILIFPFGADLIKGWNLYSEQNALYQYYKEQGFDIFCGVDSAPYFVQFNGTSMRMMRRDIDGYRMYYNADRLSDLFDVEQVWDEQRPTPVPEI